MENRPLVRRGGSALAVLLVSAVLLGSLLLLCAAQFDTVQSEVEDSLIYVRLETAARDWLEKVTLWVEKSKPVGPLGSFEGVTLANKESPERLNLTLPSELAEYVYGNIIVSARLQWCVYTPWTILAEKADYPPAIGMTQSGIQNGIGLFRQTFENSYAGGVQNLSAEFGAWRIIVNAKLKDAPESGACRVGFERVLVLDR